MNNNYLDVLYGIIDDEIENSLEKERFRQFINEILNEEKKYEFSESRPNIRNFLDDLLTKKEELK